MQTINLLWNRINALVPEPDCGIRDNDYDSMVWRDKRPQPSATALAAVDLAAIAQAEKDDQTDITNRLSDIAGKTHAQLDSYMDTHNVSNLAIRKLFHVNLALLRKLKLNS